MESYDQTVHIHGSKKNSLGTNGILTVFDAGKAPYQVPLQKGRKTIFTFGRSEENDIILSSQIVSRLHGKIFYSNGQMIIEDCNSRNGLLYNGRNISSHVINSGDFIRIDDGVETISSGVLFIFSEDTSTNHWISQDITGREEITIGRDMQNTICLSHIGVSKVHAKIVKEDDDFYLLDNKSTNGVTVNNHPVNGKVRLQEKDVITITNTKIIFTSAAIYYCQYKKGISVDVSDAVVQRGKGETSFITCNHVEVNIRPGELVSIIGGSGAGKSTLLNCMCGYLKPMQGAVYINGVNLYENFNALKKIIGYVPQSDIVYDNLTLYDMLLYTARLRLPKDTSPEEQADAIRRAIHTVDLDEKADSMIRTLSGGQRKRASIAVELLSDPSLLFLDEPASGLDPGTERTLMQSLRQMSDSGKTVILVTHSTLQLKLCDKILFMGKGGNLCFCGSYQEALDFFGIDDIVDVSAMITDQATQWSQRYRSRFQPDKTSSASVFTPSWTPKDHFRQLRVLCARYAKLMYNDRQRLGLLLCQAPVLAVLIYLVANGQQFEQYEMTKSLLFALSCSAFWIGMLNAIQEVCKERIILRREYMTGLSISSYLLSKILILGGLCLVQSILVTGVFSLLIGLPDTGLMFPPYMELLITTLLTALASVSMGLFVSCLFTNADRAMTVAPILLMPQILFSGLIFKLDGATEIVSWFAICRWSMESYGTSANLNDLSLKMQQEGINIPHDAEKFFTFTQQHMLTAWAILVLFLIVFLVLARVSLSKLGRE